MDRNVFLPAGLPEPDVQVFRAAAANQEDSRFHLRELLANRSDLVEAIGTLASELEHRLIEHAAGPQILIQEGIRAELKLMRDSLLQPQDGTLEKLLIDQVVLCWLNLTTAERQRDQDSAEDTSVTWADFWDRHVSRLRGDLLRATRALASVRRILVPALQVNIAQRQVNVSGQPSSFIPPRQPGSQTASDPTALTNLPQGLEVAPEPGGTLADERRARSQ